MADLPVLDSILAAIPPKGWFTSQDVINASIARSGSCVRRTLETLAKVGILEIENDPTKPRKPVWYRWSGP